jgi:hypothetical protein
VPEYASERHILTSNATLPGGDMSIRWTRRLAAGTLAAGLALVAVLAGCSASDSSDSAPTSGGAEPGAARQEGANQGDANTQAGAGAPNKDAPPAQPGQAPQDPLAAASRAIIYNGTITVRVTNVDKAAADVLALVNGTEGFVGADERRSNDRRSEAKIVLRVPASRFTATLDAVKGFGKEESRQVSTQDVTEQLVDLEARIANQKASVERVRALLARAQTIGEIVQLEAELSRREAELNSLTGRKNKLDDLTALSTVTVQLLGPEARLDTVDEDETGFLAGLERGWKAFQASLEVLLTILGALLPWAIGLGVPAYLLIWFLRRLPRRRETVAAPAPAYAYAGGMRPVGTPPAPAPAPRPAPAPPAGAADPAAADRATPAPTDRTEPDRQEPTQPST